MSFLDTIKAAQSFSGSSRPRVGIGRHNVKATAADYAKNQAGTSFRGMVKWEVLDGEAATGLVNTYLTEGKTDEQTASNLKPYIDILEQAGYDISKLEDEDTEGWQDIINAIINGYNKLLRKGVETVATVVVKANPKDPEHPYRNVYPLQEQDVLEVPKIPADIMAQLPGDPKVTGFAPIKEMPAIAF